MFRGGDSSCAHAGGAGRGPCSSRSKSRARASAEPKSSVLQFANARVGEWVDLDLVSRERSKEWSRALRGHADRVLSDDGSTRVSSSASRRSCAPEVEIVDVRMLVDGQDALSCRSSSLSRSRSSSARPAGASSGRLAAIHTSQTACTCSGSRAASGRRKPPRSRGHRRRPLRVRSEPVRPGRLRVEAAAANGFDLRSELAAQSGFRSPRRSDAVQVSRERQLVLMGPVNHRFPITVERSGDVDRVPRAVRGEFARETHRREPLRLRGTRAGGRRRSSGELRPALPRLSGLSRTGTPILPISLLPNGRRVIACSTSGAVQPRYGITGRSFLNRDGCRGGPLAGMIHGALEKHPGASSLSDAPTICRSKAVPSTWLSAPPCCITFRTNIFPLR